MIKNTWTSAADRLTHSLKWSRSIAKNSLDGTNLRAHLQPCVQDVDTSFMQLKSRIEHTDIVWMAQATKTKRGDESSSRDMKAFLPVTSGYVECATCQRFFLTNNESI